MTKKMNLAKVLTLSLLLAGMNTMYITPGAEAAVDATTTVTKDNVDAGGYNSIKVSTVDYDGAVSGASGAFSVLMSGDRIIEKKVNNSNDVAFATGVLGAPDDGVSVSGDGLITINASATAGSSQSPNAYAYAYGLRAEGSGKVTVNGDVKISTVATGGSGVDAGNGIAASGEAYGLYSLDGGSLTITGNVNIETLGKVKTAGQLFRSISILTGGFSSNSAGTTNLTSTGKTKVFKGDVEATGYGTNNIVMDTDTSYLQGNIISSEMDKQGHYGVNNITISNGATWRPVYDSRYGTDCVEASDPEAITKNVAANKVSERTVDENSTITLNKDGIIDLTWDGWTTGQYDTTRAYRTNGKQQTNTFRSLTIAKLAGSDGIIKIDSNLAKGLSDTLTVGAASTATSIKVQVNYDDFYANSVKGDLVTGKALVVTDNSSGKNLTVSGTKSEYNEKTYNVTVEKDATETNKWNITKIEDIGGTPTPNITENTRHAADSRDNVNNIWEIETK